jgi:hypothetical protein
VKFPLFQFILLVCFPFLLVDSTSSLLYLFNLHCSYSGVDFHAGDNVIVGSRDGKLCWFDMDLSSKPYKVLKYAALFFVIRLFFYNHLSFKYCVTINVRSQYLPLKKQLLTWILILFFLVS